MVDFAIIINLYSKDKVRAVRIAQEAWAFIHGWLAQSLITQCPYNTECKDRKYDVTFHHNSHCLEFWIPSSRKHWCPNWIPELFHILQYLTNENRPLLKSETYTYVGNQISFMFFHGKKADS